MKHQFTNNISEGSDFGDEVIKDFHHIFSGSLLFNIQPPNSNKPDNTAETVSQLKSALSK